MRKQRKASRHRGNLLKTLLLSGLQFPLPILSIEAVTVQAENKAPVQCVNSSPAEGLVWVVSTPGQPKVKYLTLFQSISMTR